MNLCELCDLPALWYDPSRNQELCNQCAINDGALTRNQCLLLDGDEDANIQP